MEIEKVRVEPEIQQVRKTEQRFGWLDRETKWANIKASQIGLKVKARNSQQNGSLWVFPRNPIKGRNAVWKNKEDQRANSCFKDGPNGNGQNNR